MSIKFDNDKGVSTAIAGIIVIVVYLFLVSFFISFFTVNIYGGDALGSNSIVLPSSSNIQIFSNTQNYTSGTNEKGLLNFRFGSDWQVIPNTGLTLINFNALLGDFSYIYVNFLHAIDGYYTNEYFINNSVKGDYVIVLDYSSSIPLISSAPNYIYVQSEGFCVNQQIIGCGYFYNYPNANQYEDVIIKTVYYDKSPRSVEFYFNGEHLFTTDTLYEENPLTLISPKNFGGVGSNTIGFVLKEYRTENPIAKDEGYNLFSSLINVVIVLAKMTVWNLPSWILPLELQAVLITLPEAVLVICIAVVVRGN